jgi:phenylacetate-CoA ligase
MLYEWLVPQIILPLHDRLTGKYTWREVKGLQRLQWLPHEELERRAFAKLLPLLMHAYEQVPYYRTLFEQSGTHPRDLTGIADLAKLPILYSQNLRENYKGSLLAVNLAAKRRVEAFTSGSSGLPLKFYRDKKAQCHARASWLYFRSLAGIEPYDAFLWTMSPPHLRSFRLNVSPMERIARRYILDERICQITGDEAAPSDIHDFVRELGISKDYFIFGQPSHFEILLRKLGQADFKQDRPPKAVVSYAQTLSPQLRERIGEVFNCPVFDLYSSLEVYFMAFSCPDNPGIMHINTERAWVRVVNEAGQDCQPGETGRVVVTDLYNYVNPLINYDLNDYAKMGEPCPCGRGFPVLQSLEGRVSECLHLKNGKTISSGTFGRILFYESKYLPYIWEYQAVQHSETELTLNIVPTAKMTGDIRRKIQADVQKHFGPDAKIEMLMVESLPHDPVSGKRPVIVSHLSDDIS